MPAEHESRIDPAAALPEAKAGAVLPWLLLLLVLAAVVFIRLRLSPMPLDRDEGEYAYFGRLMLDGVMPYLTAYNLKWPGTYAGYAAIMAVLGQSAVAIRLGLTLVNLLTAFLVYRIGRRCTSGSGACLAAGVYLVLSISPSVLGLAAHAEHFVLVPGLIGVWLAQEPGDHRRHGRLVLAGVAAGVATIMKQSGAAFFVFQLAWVVLCAHRERLGVRTAAGRLASLAAGFAAPIGIMLIGIASTGAFGRFWFWTWTYARAYAANTTLAAGAGNLAAQLWRMVHAAPVLWIGVSLGVWTLFTSRADARHRVFAGVFAGSSFLGVCAGLNFSPHYAVLVLPAAALLAGMAVAAGTEFVVGRPRWSRLAGIWVWLAAAGVAQALYLGRGLYFVQTPPAASRTIYRFNPYIEAIAVGSYLRTHCPQEAGIAVIGSEPEICFYARRRSVTGYLYTYAMLENQPYAGKMQREFFAEIEQGAPAYVVFVDLAASWLHGAQSGRGGRNTVLDWFQRYERENLTLLGLVELSDGREQEWQWRFAGPKAAQPSGPWIAIYRRMPAPAGAAGPGGDAGRQQRTTIAW